MCAQKYTLLSIAIELGIDGISAADRKWHAHFKACKAKQAQVNFDASREVSQPRARARGGGGEAPPALTPTCARAVLSLSVTRASAARSSSR